MTEYIRHVLKGALVIVMALGLGLTTAWIIIKLQSPEPTVGPLEHVMRARR